MSSGQTTGQASKDYNTLFHEQVAQELLRRLPAEDTRPAHAPSPALIGMSAEDVCEEEGCLTPGTLAVEHARATYTDEQQLTYATVLISWLAYEGPLPPPLRTARQRKRDNANAKKSGGGSGVLVNESGWQPARIDADAFPPLRGA